MGVLLFAAQSILTRDHLHISPAHWMEIRPPLPTNWIRPPPPVGGAKRRAYGGGDAGPPSKRQECLFRAEVRERMSVMEGEPDDGDGC